MFGFSWAEIGLIMAVALIAIGPKDLPVAIKTVTGLMKKARGMAAEFQGHIDEMMRDANLSEVKTEINKLRRFDFKAAAEQTIDPDGSIKSALAEAEFGDNAIQPVPNSIYSAPVVEVTEDMPEAPAFIPPEAVRKQPVPAFIPPGTKRWGY
ncbi:MAG TPA: Sec-independent protein translocase protein TatB [Acidocella sp.]|nr:MAG: twin arginine-targeting protein translocase TatB [Acidocella sp. 20-61-6]HQT39470.1 Sec-independent protein translocase protein TatB [Acidocella sp.]